MLGSIKKTKNGGVGKRGVTKFIKRDLGHPEERESRRRILSKPSKIKS